MTNRMGLVHITCTKLPRFGGCPLPLWSPALSYLSSFFFIIIFHLLSDPALAHSAVGSVKASSPGGSAAGPVRLTLRRSTDIKLQQRPLPGGERLFARYLFFSDGLT